MTRRLLAAEVESIVRGEHGNPHDFLGHHGGLVRVWRPGAASVTVGRAKAEKIHDAGLFEARLAESVTDYEIEVRYPDGTVSTVTGIDSGPFAGGCGIALDSAGNIFFSAREQARCQPPKPIAETFSPVLPSCR